MKVIPNNLKPLVASGLVLGVGLGGFFDGILFHQILQVHSMLSHQVPRTSIANIEVNMFWDGLFHALTWTATVVGLFLLWRAVKKPEATLYPKTLMGSMLTGWGLFNFIEGLIDHHALEVHHVVEGAAHRGWDYVFLGSGLLLVAVGYWLAKQEFTKTHFEEIRTAEAA